MKFPKEIYFSREKFFSDLFLVIYPKISVYPDKFAMYSKILGKLFYFT